MHDFSHVGYNGESIWHLTICTTCLSKQWVICQLLTLQFLRHAHFLKYLTTLLVQSITTPFIVWTIIPHPRSMPIKAEPAVISFITPYHSFVNLIASIINVLWQMTRLAFYVTHCIILIIIHVVFHCFIIWCVHCCRDVWLYSLMEPLWYVCLFFVNFLFVLILIVLEYFSALSNSACLWNSREDTLWILGEHQNIVVICVISFHLSNIRIAVEFGKG